MKPKNIAFTEAAGIPLVGLTSWQALMDVARIQPGSRVFIQAGAGGIVSFAIQLAKAQGAFVATMASKKNEPLVRSLGADQVIDYHSQAFESILRDQDIVFDTLGGEALYKSFSIVKPGGHVISIAGDPDANVALELGLGFFKTAILSWIGRKAHRLANRYGAHYHFLFMKPDGGELSKISTLIEQGKIKPIVDRVYGLDRVQEGIEYSASGRAKGKIVIRIKSD